ncbi:MAG: hypothetical protein KME54_23280 [Tolypothrix brevis GSE-NOS-MK-07-07A]|jgi:hypothetical protein|nr:hypothetical protein [Tolypothrix brevis GSE-NOS-MK-07-07A]
MAEPSLTAVFGNNATQDETTLTISKADLATVGLTSSVTNTPESLLAAIIALAQVSLTEVAYNANLDQSIIISDTPDLLVTRNNVLYRQATKTVEFYKPDDSGNFDPDDY